MKKQIILRGIMGFPIGIAIGYTITIIISYIYAQGYYAACVPAMAQQLGSELNAVTVQALLSGILGAAFSGASVIWEIDNWSIAKQSFVYFVICALFMFPIAYFTHWMKHSLSGFIAYFTIFTVIFLAVWLIQYAVCRFYVNSINKKIN